MDYENRISIDVLQATAAELETYLRNGETTCKDIVEAYHDQIQRHNKAGLHLNAMFTVTPYEILIAQAEKRDEERSSGKPCGKLHGIPIILKVRGARLSDFVLEQRPDLESLPGRILH